jgi:Plasmid pRiA4b ORF-3-like protein
MKQARKPDPQGSSLAVDAAAIVQIKIWLLGVSPMVWRRVQVSGSTTLRELHGVIQVAMGWEGIHLYQFSLRATRFGSAELSASSPDVTLAALRLRQRARFLYEYDLNIPWRHGVRIEEILAAQPNMAYPVCAGGNGACPPEDCHDPAAFMSGSVHAVSWEALEDLGTMAEILEQVVIEHRVDLLDDEDTRWRLEQAVDRTRARERAKGTAFSRRRVNERLSQGEYRELMHQHY